MFGLQLYRDLIAHLEANTELVAQLSASLARLEQRFERDDYALERNELALERSKLALERNERTLESTFERLDRIVDDFIAESREWRDQIRANTEATWRMLDKFGQGESPA